MANSKQASKRARQSEKSRVRNKWQRTRVNSQIKLVRNLISEKEFDKARTELHLTISLIDKLANKGIIHANKAARHKSRLSTQLKTATAA